VSEYPCAEGDPYYPIPRPENAVVYRKYQALADELRRQQTIFDGLFRNQKQWIDATDAVRRTGSS